LQENLNKGLSAVSKAIAQRGSLPVLSNVLLEAKKGRVKLSATNLETSITTWVGAKVEKGGSITIPARVLSEFIANLPASQIDCSVSGLTLTVKAENAFSKFNGLDASEFPSLPSEISKKSLQINPTDFNNAVSEVYFSAAADDSRPILTGVLLKTEGSLLTLVGVDGFRLSERKMELPKKVDEDFTAVVSARTLMEAAKLFSHDEDDVQIELNKEANLVIFKGSDILVSSRLLEGEYPDYQKIIPSSGSSKLVVGKDDLINAVRLAGVFAKDGANIIKLNMNPSTPEIILSSEASEIGENETKVSADKGNGEELITSFNGRYLTDLLSNTSSKKVSLETSGSLNPALFRIDNRSDYLHIIMPVRVQE